MTRTLFDKPVSHSAKQQPIKISRSKIDLFIQCPRCFYFDKKLGIKQPFGPPFTLNNAVDQLLKKEFDIHRTKQEAHPLMKNYSIDAVPYHHPDINNWRNNFVGIQHLHESTNLLIFGAIDDIWQDQNGKIYIVDYKATSTRNKITLDDKWKSAYKRQMEIYQWLFQRNGFDVSDVGYFVYVNGKTDREAFDGKLEFDVQIIPYEGDNSWVEKTIFDIHKCLQKDKAPAASPECEYCNYVDVAKKVD
jgi:CRISPR/Cas system-associated exonuclease Cas4 (RecB family)